MFRLSIILFSLLIVSTSSPVFSRDNFSTPSKKKMDGISYILNYQRWGDFGSYHLGMKLTMLSDGKPTATWYINGGWDTTLAHDTLLVYQIPALFPVFLRAYVHPAHPTSPLFNVRSWNDFGKTQVIKKDAAVKLITMAHSGMTKINEGEYLYSPVVKPFKLGNMGFWTSNSYVASLIHWVNESSPSITRPEGGTYPGIDGPFLPMSVFEKKANE